MEHKFEWNKEKKELVEIREGDQLVDAKQNKVEGRFENKTIYPHHTALEFIKELERQIAHSKIEEKAIENEIKKLDKKLRPVGAEFFEKFKACMARMQMTQKQDVLKEKIKARETVEEQFNKIKEVMPS